MVTLLPLTTTWLAAPISGGLRLSRSSTVTSAVEMPPGTVVPGGNRTMMTFPVVFSPTFGVKLMMYSDPTPAAGVVTVTDTFVMSGEAATGAAVARPRVNASSAASARRCQVFLFSLCFLCISTYSP